MPYIVHVSSCISVSKEFEPELSLDLLSIITFGPVTPETREAIPRTLIVGRPSHNTVPAILGWHIGPFIVCARVRDILEELEPGRHDFVPINVKSKAPIGGKMDHGLYHLILPPPRLDAVVIEETAFARGVGREGYETSSGRISSDPKARCVLDGAVIAGHHFWQLARGFGHNPRFPGSGHIAYFCSDEFLARIRVEKLGGWDVKKRCTVKQPTIM